TPPAVTLASLRGKPALINFWASWCHPCQEEAPRLQRFAAGLGGRGHLAGVDYSDAPSDARAFIRRYRLTFPVPRDGSGTTGGGHIGVNSRADDRSSASEPEPVFVPGTPAAFRYLVNQRSNRCGMRPAELESFPPTQHLQGSCCDPMDQSTYEWQVKALRSYS